MTTVDVTKFGAIANDGKNDADAVRDALEYCKKTGPATLVFPKGTYNFACTTLNQGVLFLIHGLDNLTIDGRGSQFVIHGVCGVFYLSDGKNLTLKNFTLDWDRPFFSLGKVLATEGKHFDVEVFPEYPVKGGETVGAFMDYDPKSRMPLPRGLDEYYSSTKTELLREQVLRVHLNHDATIKPGVLVLLRHQVYGPGGFRFDRCSDVTVKDIAVHSAPGMGLNAAVCTNVTLERFRVVPRPGSGHLMSATADATHFQGCKGTIRMDGCEYEGMGDDGVNIKSGLYLSLKKKVDDHTVIAAHNLKIVDRPDPGDRMEISHVDDLIPYATVTVKKVEGLPDDGRQRVEFEEALPAQLREGDVFGNATRTPKVRIRNTQVRNNRARGMLIQTRDAIIDNCTFRNCTGPGIMVLTEVVYFFESIGTRDVTVRNSTFDNCNYGAAIGPGALCAMAYLKDFAYPPKPGVHRNVVFENNTIIGSANSGIFAAGVDGLTIRGNGIEKVCADPKDEAATEAIHVQSSSGVRIEKNRIDPTKQGSGFRKAIEKVGE